MSPGFVRRLLHHADASLRARLVIPTAVLAAASAALMVFIATGFHNADMRREHIARAMLFASLVTEALMTNMAENEHSNTTKILQELKGHRPDLTSLTVVGRNGYIGTTTDPTLGRKWEVDPAGLDLQGPMAVPGSRDFALVRPLYNEHRCAGCHGEASKANGWLELRFSSDRQETKERTLTDSLVLAALPSFLLLLGVSWWLLGREAVHPIQRLVAAMKRAEAGATDVKADEGRTDEIGVAARKFDATLAALRRSQAELEKIYENRMERADRFAMIGQMATGLAHEIKNPLAGLSGALELLAEDLAESQHAEVVAEMRHQVKRLSDIMVSLLGFARPPRAHFQDTDVNAALEKVFFLIGQQRSSTAVTIRQELAPQLPTINADPSQLEQVFLNIGLNAFQAVTPKGGAITVRSVTREDQVVVEFTDTGPGIAPAIRSSIFTPFFTTRSNGTGLGLALSMRLVSEHGGKMWFSCPDGGGTTFFVSLPIRGGAQVGEKPAFEAQAGPGPRS